MQELTEMEIRPTTAMARRSVSPRFIGAATVICGPIVGLTLAGTTAQQLRRRGWAATCFGGAIILFGLFALLLLAGVSTVPLQATSIASLPFAFPLAAKLRREAEAAGAVTISTKLACAATAGVALAVFISLFTIITVAQARSNGGPARVASVVLTHDLHNGKAVDNTTTFDGTGTIYALVMVDGTRHKPTVRVAWTLVAPDDAQHSNVPLGDESEQLGSGDAGLTARLYPKQPGDSMQPGRYRFSVYIDGALAQTLDFTVR